MDIVYKATVGSKMHGLDTPASDEDIRHIFMHSLREIISPFKKKELRVNSLEHFESWELCHFVKHLSSGNPTCYEVIKSPLYDASLPLAEEIRNSFPLYFYACKILSAHIGYAKSTQDEYLDWGTLSTQWLNINGLAISPDFRKRIPKSIVAAYRILAQGEQLLTTGDFKAKVRDYDINLHYRLMQIKTMDVEDVTESFCEYHNRKIEEGIQNLKNTYEKLSPKIRNTKADINGIEDFLCRVYGAVK